MGNVNGREDGGGSDSPSGAEEGSSPQENMAAQDASNPTRYHSRPDADADFMGQSPPPSPRASHSPLMFRPQVSFLSSSTSFSVSYGLPCSFDGIFGALGL